MTSNPIAGTGVFLLGGVAAALYLLPFRGVKGWRYETGWLVSVLGGWLVWPLLFDSWVIPDLFAVIASGGAVPVVRTVMFGMLWGVGALCWALMVRYLGVGLGLAIGAGLCAATGTLLPPLVTGHAADLVATRGACVVLAGVAVALAGIVLVGAAGRLKESEMSTEAKRKAVADYDFRKGLVTALIAGVASAGINFGLQGAPDWEEAALARGVRPLWAGMPVLTVVLLGGVVTQVLWVAWKRFGAKSGGGETPSAPCTFAGFVRNLLLSVTVGVVGMSQFLFQKVGEPLMGEMRYISFAVLMASAIFFSTVVGTVLGEWKGTSSKTRRVLALGIAVLLASFLMISLGQ